MPGIHRRIGFPAAALGCGLLAILLLGPVRSAAADGSVFLYWYQMRLGDDPAWSDPGYDDSGWEETTLDAVPHSDSIVWLRKTIEITPEQADGEPLGLFFAGMASFQLWWDGQMVMSGGVVGATPEEEDPGPIQTHALLPSSLSTPGVHHVALRLSAHHRHFEPSIGIWSLVLGPYDAILASSTSHTWIALMSLSGIVMMSLFSLMMFFQDPGDRSFLYLSLLCLVGALLLVAESYRNLFGYAYNWHLLRLVVVTGLAWLLDVALLVFLTRRFPLPGARWLVALGAVATAVPMFTFHGWDPRASYGLLIAIVLGSLWCAWAVWRRQPGSWLALLGMAGCGIALWIDPDRFVERNLYLALDFLLVCLLASHVLQVRRVRREREEARLKSARLEIELLKKHIQPHFLMNTLTALSEWIEEEPKVAASMIQSLAEEFRILSDISNQRLIRMEDELRLCTSHVQIMSHRKGRQYHLTTEGLDPDARIPPAVIHTLLENAITHGPDDLREVEFRLHEDIRNGRRRYVFESPYGAGDPTASSREGTGLRYIRARLQESFGEGWRLGSGPAGDRWRTEIEVPA